MSGGDFGWDEQKKQIKHELEKLEIWRVNSNGGVLKIPDKETIEKITVGQTITIQQFGQKDVDAFYRFGDSDDGIYNLRRPSLNTDFWKIKRFSTAALQR